MKRPALEEEWLAERAEIEAELIALWGMFAVQYDDDSDGIDFGAEFPPYPEGVPLVEVLRRLSDYL